MLQKVPQKILDLLTELKIYVNQDGGDMEVVGMDGKTVYIRLAGNCVGCGLIDITFKEGIEQILIEQFPKEVNSVEIVM